MITKLIAKTTVFFRSPLVLSNSVFRFSTEETAAQNERDLSSAGDEQELDRAANFYRNSIRRININDKGRGKFTQHHLLRLTKLTEKPEQVPLLFEAYYNYLGHFTVISNTTVDRMLQKAMSFEDAPLQSVLEIFSTHNYLNYFPHYRVTQRLISLTEKDEQLYKKLLEVFLYSPLIKFDQAIVNRLLEHLHQTNFSRGVFTLVAKLLIQRSCFGIINECITPIELLKHISEGLQTRLVEQSFQSIRSNQQVAEYLNKIKAEASLSQQQHYQLAVVYLSFGNRAGLTENLGQITNKALLQQLFKLVSNCKESYRSSLVSFLSNQELNEEIHGYLERVKSGSEPSNEQ